jgi:integrase
MSKREDGAGTVWLDRDKKKWRARLQLAADPKPRTKSFRTKTEALAWIRAAKAAPAPTEYTVQRAYDEWVAMHADGIWRQSTREQYAYFFARYILPAIGTMAVEDVRAKHVQSVIAGMATHGSTKKTAKGLSTKTMKGARIAMHGLFAWLMESEIVDKNPCTKIKIPETVATPRRALAPAEVPALVESMEHSRWQNSVRFILLTGLRRGELLALRWDDIIKDDKGHSWVKVSRTRSRDGEEGPPKSRAGLRTMRIGKAVQAILDAQRDMLIVDGLRPWTPDPDVKDDKPKKGETAYVFPAYTGDPVQPNTYYYNIRKLAEKANVRISIHELRHTFVSISGRGMDLKSLQSVLGHTSSTQTLDLYRHILDGDLERAANVVDSTAYTLGIVPEKDFQRTTPETTPDAEKRVPG